MASTSGISKLFISVISLFVRDYTEEAFIVAQSIRRSKRLIKKQLEDKAIALLAPIVEDMFTEAIKASNQIMRREIVNLSDLTKVPFKYNRDVIDRINSKSVFTGFYDTQYKSLYKKREIDALKRTILQGKYANWDDKRLAAEIRKTINISKNRALTTARMESQRLEGAAQQIFYEQAKVKEQYVKMYSSRGDARPSHKALDGQIADDEGYFTDSGGNKFLYPPPPDSPFGCRCRSVLVKRDKV
jgi:hypothetical protein